MAAAVDVSVERAAESHSGWAEIPGGDFLLGASKDAPFLFDNEKWAHPVVIEPFEIAKSPVTNREFQAFVDDGGTDQCVLTIGNDETGVLSGEPLAACEPPPCS